MSDAFPDHPLWDFSLRVYTDESVKRACLGLQQRHQLDVNVLMFCMWLGDSGRGALSGAEMTALTGTVAPWHHVVVRAMRAVRTAMKGGLPPAPVALSESLRRRILKIEVDCEHVEQLMLAGAVERAPQAARAPADRVADAAANIGRYLACHGLAAVAAADRDDLAILLAAAFPAIGRDRIAALCGTLMAG